MLPLYEAYGKYDLPEKLERELYDAKGELITHLDKLSKINIFVGPNNSGKSLLMRELLRSYSKTHYSEDKWLEIKRELAFFQKVSDTLRRSSGIVDITSFGNYQNGVIMDLNSLTDIYNHLLQYRADYDVTSVVDQLKGFFDRQFTLETNKQYFYNNRANVQTDITSQKNVLEKIFDCLNDLKSESIQVIKRLLKFKIPLNATHKRIYIPTVRSLKPFFGSSHFENATRNDYAFDPDSIEIFTGQQFAEAIENHKNNTSEFRNKIEAYENFLSETFFQNEKITLTYHKNEKILLIKIGMEKDRPIYQLGDGLQMIVILTFPFFMYDAGTIAIEEPELFIHPGLQRELMHFLATHNKTRNFQVFLTTHSNHILDSINASSLISIFSITKKKKSQQGLAEGEDVPDFIFENLAYGDENVLRLLGVTSTSVYLSNCVIWVEGITDKIYFQKFIEAYLDNNTNLKDKYKYFKNLKEGINYSFSLTGGDSIVHFEFNDDSEYATSSSKIIVNKFCSKSLVIADNDFQKNLPRKQELRNALGDRFIELEFPEVENLLPKDIFEETLLSYKSVKYSVGNNRLQVLSEDELKSHKIGELIDSVILKDYTNRKLFCGVYGSLKAGDKYEFCIRAIKFVNHSNLPRYTATVIEKLLDFIISMNPGYKNVSKNLQN